MMLKGPGNESPNPEWGDLAPEVAAAQAGAPLTPQFQARQRDLTPTQLDYTQSYFEEQILPNFQQFIAVAPGALQPLRQFIITHVANVSCDIFEKLLTQYYPAVLQTDPTSQQNLFFRQLLLSFNSLCNGTIDIDHPLYATIFDPRYSPTKSSSPTKRNLVTHFFKQKIHESFNFSASDPFVIQAMAWLKEHDGRFNEQSADQTGHSARKKLFFG